MIQVRNDFEAIVTMALPERQLEPVAAPSWFDLLNCFISYYHLRIFYKLLALKNVALILIFPLRWIYVIAALCGLLLLLTIVLILAKVFC